jgi:hypothetical protein
VLLVQPGSSWTALLPSLIVTGIGMGMFNPPRAAVTVGVVGPARAGMASGMGQTFQQVGVAMGVSGFGALFQSCVVSEFVHSSAGQQLGNQADSVGHSIAAGDDLAGTVPAGQLGSVITAGHVAFVHGLTEVVGMCAVAAALGAALVFYLIRRRDLHQSALATSAPRRAAVPGSAVLSDSAALPDSAALAHSAHAGHHHHHHAPREPLATGSSAGDLLVQGRAQPEEHRHQ